MWMMIVGVVIAVASFVGLMVLAILSGMSLQMIALDRLMHSSTVPSPETVRSRIPAVAKTDSPAHAAEPQTVE